MRVVALLALLALARAQEEVALDSEGSILPRKDEQRPETVAPLEVSAAVVDEEASPAAPPAGVDVDASAAASTAAVDVEASPAASTATVDAEASAAVDVNAEASPAAPPVAVDVDASAAAPPAADAMAAMAEASAAGERPVASSAAATSSTASSSATSSSPLAPSPASTPAAANTPPPSGWPSWSWDALQLDAVALFWLGALGALHAAVCAVLYAVPKVVFDYAATTSRSEVVLWELAALAALGGAVWLWHAHMALWAGLAAVGVVGSILWRL